VVALRWGTEIMESIGVFGIDMRVRIVVVEQWGVVLVAPVVELVCVLAVGGIVTVVRIVAARCRCSAPSSFCTRPLSALTRASAWRARWTSLSRSGFDSATRASKRARAALKSLMRFLIPASRAMISCTCTSFILVTNACVSSSRTAAV